MLKGASLLVPGLPPAGSTSSFSVEWKYKDIFRHAKTQTFTLHTLFPKNLLKYVLKHKQQRNKIKEDLECKKYWHQPRKAGQLFQEEISPDERKGKRDLLERKESKGESVQ